MLEQKAKVLVAQFGARKHYQEPILLHQWDLLDSLYTDFYAGHSQLTKLLRESRLYQPLPKNLKKLLDRYDPALEAARVFHFPQLAYKYKIALNKASPQERSQINIQTGKEFCQRIIQQGLGNANVIYGFDGASLELFEYAKSKGIRCILDQTVAERALIHQLLLKEEQIWAGWSKSPFQVYKGDLELVQRQQQEQDLAERIICGSNFVKDSLVSRGVEADKISVVSLGRCQDNQLSAHNRERKTPQERGDGLKILFGGSVCLRKGIPYLLNALRQIKGEIPFTCKVAGNIKIQSDKVAEFIDVAEFLGLVPRSQMKELYAWADVFVLPSVCEGSAMVTYEALNWELPVITTYNSGSIVRDSIDGFIVPIQDTKEIANKLLFLYANKLNSNREKDCYSYWQQIQVRAREEFENCLIQV